MRIKIVLLLFVGRRRWRRGVAQDIHELPLLASIRESGGRSRSHSLLQYAVSFFLRKLIEFENEVTWKYWEFPLDSRTSIFLLKDGNFG